jgi:hypothetical protein
MYVHVAVGLHVQDFNVDPVGGFESSDGGTRVPSDDTHAMSDLDTSVPWALASRLAAAGKVNLGQIDPIEAMARLGGIEWHVTTIGGGYGCVADNGAEGPITLGGIDIVVVAASGSPGTGTVSSAGPPPPNPARPTSRRGQRQR